jgi:hypothetical protein
LAEALIDFVHVGICCVCAGRRKGGGSVLNLERLLGFFFVGAAVPAMNRRPGASLANPNKAARRVTAVEFASDSDDT